MLRQFKAPKSGSDLSSGQFHFLVIRCKKKVHTKKSSMKNFGAPKTLPLKILYVGLFPWYSEGKRGPKHKDFAGSGVLGGRVWEGGLPKFFISMLFLVPEVILTRHFDTLCWVFLGNRKQSSLNFFQSGPPNFTRFNFLGPDLKSSDTSNLVGISTPKKNI